MLLTPDQAKTRWCPFARVHSLTGPYNRQPPGSPMEARGARCIADECMAWRWGAEKSEGRHFIDGPPPEKEGWQRTAGTRNHYTRAIPNPRGQCGLAHHTQE